jgi:uncharacterized protein YndB with AHSA1/START domain
MTNDLSLKVSQHVPASPERVFDAWLDPKMISRFMITGPTAGVKSAETDPRIGGRYAITMTNEMGEIPHWGEYREIDRPTRLVFTWNSPHAAPDSLVTLTFDPAGIGGTLVTLVHDKFPSEGSREGHTKGWTAILETLSEKLPEFA